jgi:hypothetical protein
VSCCNSRKSFPNSTTSWFFFSAIYLFVKNVVNSYVDSMKRGSKSLNGEDDTHELPLPKSSSKQQSHSGNMRESHAKEKSDKPRQPKRHSKHSTPNDSFNETKHTSREQSIPKDTDSLQLQGEDANDNLPPKMAHSKKTKDVQGVGGSSKSRSKSQVKESNSKSK